MDFIDYYKALGIDKTASADQVKKAYRKLARKLHPDLNPTDKNAHAAFQKINEANEVLSDPEKRKKYDKYGKDGEHGEQMEQQRESQRQQRQHSQRGQQFAGDADGDFSSFFESMLGGEAGSRRASARYRGQDYNAELELSLTDIMETHKQTIQVNGKSVRINIPAGIEHGQKIRLTGYGAPGSEGGPAGDLYITFSISPHPVFKRSGSNLYSTGTVDLYTALLWGAVTVDTMTGKVKLKVNPEIQSGTEVRLRGKGLPFYKQEGQTGDLFVTYQVKLPTNLTEQQKTLFTELSKLQ